MKYHKKAIRFLALICLMTMFLTACGDSGLNGTYISTGTISQSFTFSDETIVMSAFGINATGTYEIKDGNIIISYTLFGQDCVWTQSFSQSGDTINIGGTDFIKR